MNHELGQGDQSSFQSLVEIGSMDLYKLVHRGCCIDLDMLFDMEIVVGDIRYNLVEDILKYVDRNINN